MSNTCLSYLLLSVPNARLDFEGRWKRLGLRRGLTRVGLSWVGSGRGGDDDVVLLADVDSSVLDELLDTFNK
nr:hypothetical protein [Tanacetum cinerariifolium]